MIGWLDCHAGASGDMFLGALIDAGVPLEHLQSTVDALGVAPIELRATSVSRHGIGATKVDVVYAEADPHARSWRDIRLLLETAPLPDPVRHSALRAFGYVARAEAAIHQTDLDHVHFHEVGGLDAIADIVGACAGLHWLRTHLGLRALTASTVTVGDGVTRGAHGGIPVPAPAVLSILAEVGAPVVGGTPYEACTPTGAALIAAHADGYGRLPAMVVRRVGVGAGGRDPAERANVLRLVLGEPAPTSEPGESDPTSPSPPEWSVLIECNVDDLDPRLWPGLLPILLEAGAQDAWLTPILMKKGRPAHTLHVLAPPSRAQRLRDLIYSHTSSIGIRQTVVERYPLAREWTTVDIDGHPIRVKVARHRGNVVNLSIEYEDVAATARTLQLPEKTVLARATAAAWRDLPSHLLHTPMTTTPGRRGVSEGETSDTAEEGQ